MAKNKAEARFPVNLPANTKEATEKARFGHYDNKQYKSVMTRHRMMKEHERADALEKRYSLDGVHINRFEAMEYLVSMVSEGSNPVHLCEQEGMPTLLELRRWKKWHPNFAQEMEEAEACRGQRYGEMATELPMDATNEDNAALIKLRSEALNRAAARLNPEFQEKKLIQTEDITARMTEQQLEDRLKSLMKAYPQLKAIGNDVGIEDAEIVTEEEEK